LERLKLWLVVVRTPSGAAEATRPLPFKGDQRALPDVDPLFPGSYKIATVLVARVAIRVALLPESVGTVM
jgi:hypothetical protein